MIYRKLKEFDDRKDFERLYKYLLLWDWDNLPIQSIIEYFEPEDYIETFELDLSTYLQHEISHKEFLEISGFNENQFRYAKKSGNIDLNFLSAFNRNKYMR